MSDQPFTFRRHALSTALVGMLLLTAFARAAEAPPPAAGSPVLLIGDSMMRLPGVAIERELSQKPGVEASTFAGIGTGLARLDAFDWLAKIDELCAERKPHTAVVALGANDRQPMALPEGKGIVTPGTPEWDREYAERIGKAMDRLVAGGCESVIWLLLPPMRDPEIDEHARRVNALAAEQAESRPQVSLFDAARLVAHRRTGGFTERRTDPQTAASIRIRDADGIHLTPDGARLLATALIRTYWP